MWLGLSTSDYQYPFDAYRFLMHRSKLLNTNRHGNTGSVFNARQARYFGPVRGPTNSLEQIKKFIFKERGNSVARKEHQETRLPKSLDPLVKQFITKDISLNVPLQSVGSMMEADMRRQEKEKLIQWMVERIGKRGAPGTARSTDTFSGGSIIPMYCNSKIFIFHL